MSRVSRGSRFWLSRVHVSGDGGGSAGHGLDTRLHRLCGLCFVIWCFLFGPEMGRRSCQRAFQQSTSSLARRLSVLRALGQLVWLWHVTWKPRSWLCRVTTARGLRACVLCAQDAGCHPLVRVCHVRALARDTCARVCPHPPGEWCCLAVKSAVSCLFGLACVRACPCVCE